MKRTPKVASKASIASPPPQSPRGWMSPTGYLLSEQLVAVSPTRAGAASIASLAAEIVAQHVNIGRRGLALCAAAHGAGVTFLTANLGMALAQSGVSTLIVDASFEDPQIHDLFCPPEDKGGLRDLLADESRVLAEVLHREVVPGLSILYAGHQSPSDAVVLTGGRFERLAQACLRDFDCTLFDVGPANRSSDALTISATVGYALLVARRGVSFAEDLGFLTGQLRQDGVTVIGSVFNRA